MVNSPRDKAFPVSWDRSSTGTRGRLRPGGLPPQGRSTPSSPSPAAVSFPRRSVARELEVRVIETVSIASYHDYIKTQGGLKVP